MLKALKWIGAMLLAPILVSVISQALGDYFKDQGLKQFPGVSEYAITLLKSNWKLILGWVAIVGVIWFIRKRRRSNSMSMPMVTVITVPRHGWDIVTKESYGGVSWRVLHPHRLLLDARPRLNPNELEVHAQAFCPRCDTELEERRGLLGGFTRTCVRCNGRFRSRSSISSDADKVQRIVRSKAAEELSGIHDQVEGR